MAYNFPNSPSNGDTVTVNGVVYEYNSTDNAWKTGTGSGPAILSDGSTPSLASGITAAEVRTLIDSPDLSSVDTDIIPDGDGTRDLGSSSAKWKDLYLSGNSLFLGGHSITADSSAILFPEIKIGTGSSQVTLSGGANGTLQTGGSPVFSGAFADLTGKPTTLAGYGITDGATTSYVTTQINNVIDSAPGALNTLNELAAALGDDANFSTTVTNSLAAKAPLASPSLTGTPTAPTASTGTNTTQLATTAFVQTAVSGAGGYGDSDVDSHLNRGTAATGEVLSWNGSDYDWVARTTFSTLTGKPTTLSGYGITDGASLASPAFTGTPTAPTASGGTNSTQIATTAYVQGEISSFSGGDSQRNYTASGAITNKNAVVLNSNGTVSNVSVVAAGINTSTRPLETASGNHAEKNSGVDWNSTDSVYHHAWHSSGTLYIKAETPSFSALTLSTATTTTTNLGANNAASQSIIYKHIDGTSTGILFYQNSGWKAKYVTYDSTTPTHNIGTNTLSLTGEPYDVVIKDSGRMFILYSGSVASVAIDASAKTFSLTSTASSTLTVGSGTYNVFRIFWDSTQSKLLLVKSANSSGNGNEYQYISESSGTLTASSSVTDSNSTQFHQIEYHPGLSTYFGFRWQFVRTGNEDRYYPYFTPITIGASAFTYGTEVQAPIYLSQYDAYNQHSGSGDMRFIPSKTGNSVSLYHLMRIASSGAESQGREHFAFGTLNSSGTYTSSSGFSSMIGNNNSDQAGTGAHKFGTSIDRDGYAYVSYPISYGSGGTTTKVASTLIRTASVSTAADYLGIAQNAAADGGSVTVMLAGGISTGHSSLTQDVKYYVQNDGSLATTSTSTVAGHSVSTDSIQVADSQGTFSTSTAFADLTSTPTTLSGYGITDALSSAGNVDIGSSDFITTGKSYFANMFSALSDLPSATTYHGMFAHVHATGAGYFAHGGNWIELANKSYVDTEVAGIVDSAPGTLNTLNELAAALNDDANFATTVTTSLGLKAPLASPALTGTPTAPTAASGTNTTQIATTAFVQSAVSGAGSYNDASVDTHLNRSTASTGEVLSWNGTDYDWVAQSSGGASVTVSETAPSSPSVGDLWFDPSVLKTFVYYNDGTANQWVQSNPTGGGGSSSGGGASVSISDTAPTSPTAGNLWYKSDTGALYIYYNDGNSSQWVGVSGPTGAAGASASVSYANLAAFPASPTEGDIAYAQDTNALYVYDGSEWDRISSGSDESPRVTTEPATSHTLNSDGTTSTLTMVAEDPEGFDIEYGIRYNTSGNTLPSQLASATSINQSTGVYTFTPTTTTSNAGSFNARLTASDGNRVTVRTIPFSIAFQDPITFSSAEPGISTNLTNSVVWSSSGSDSSGGMAQSANLKTGKFYFEMSLTNAGSELMIGFAPESMTDPGWNVSPCVANYSSNGNWYPGGSSTDGISGGYGTNDVLMFAYDTANRQIWMGKNGTWGGNPSTTGKSVGGTGDMTLVIGSGAGAGTSLTASIVLGTANLNYSVPTGFSAY